MKRFEAGLVGIVFLLAGSMGHGQGKGDLARELVALQGVWIIVTVDPNSSQVDRAKFAFRGDQFFRLMEKDHTPPDLLIVRDLDEFKLCRITLTGKFSLEAGDGPTNILFYDKTNVTVRGILKFDDAAQTQLRLCLAPAKANAPTSFEANDENRQVVFILNRIVKFQP